mmetsp:Transcript_25774/g.76290  ORF Transcript_25774/g.76290 Transcript_25774/m.76290 type:complete len:300 (+) Transcript_25774:1711-2610(+)
MSDGDALSSCAISTCGTTCSSCVSAVPRRANPATAMAQSAGRNVATSARARRHSARIAAASCSRSHPSDHSDRVASHASKSPTTRGSCASSSWADGNSTLERSARAPAAPDDACAAFASRDSACDTFTLSKQPASAAMSSASCEADAALFILRFVKRRAVGSLASCAGDPVERSSSPAAAEVGANLLRRSYTVPALLPSTAPKLHGLLGTGAQVSQVARTPAAEPRPLVEGAHALPCAAVRITHPSGHRSGHVSMLQRWRRTGRCTRNVHAAAVPALFNPQHCDVALTASFLLPIVQLQ